jgi:hypothetical protein
MSQEPNLFPLTHQSSDRPHGRTPTNNNNAREDMATDRATQIGKVPMEGDLKHPKWCQHVESQTRIHPAKIADLHSPWMNDKLTGYPIGPRLSIRAAAR